MIRPGKRLQDERGIALLMVALFMGAAIALVAVVLDIGAFFRDNRHLQSVVDASSLAGARWLPASGANGAACPSEVTNAAAAIASQNDPGGATLTYTCWRSSLAPAGYVNQIQVHAHKTSTSGVFSRLGVSVLTPTRDAWAEGDMLGSGAYVLPLAIEDGTGCGRQPGDPPCIGSWNGINFVSFHKYGSCSSKIDLSNAPFCWTDLSGNPGIPNETTSGGGDSTMSQWITTGYPNLITAPATTYDYTSIDCTKVNKTTGGCDSSNGHECGHNASPSSCVLIQALKARAGQVVLFPVWKSKGSSNSFNIIGFAIFRLNADASKVYMPNQNKIGDSHWWVTGQYLDYTQMLCLPPEGSTQPDPNHCYGLSGPGEDYGAHVIKLVK